MAETTTMGRRDRRPFTICAVRSIAVASITEVPPNFITIMKHLFQVSKFQGFTGCKSKKTKQPSIARPVEQSRTVYLFPDMQQQQADVGYP